MMHLSCSCGGVTFDASEFVQRSGKVCEPRPNFAQVFPHWEKRRKTQVVVWAKNARRRVRDKAKRRTCQYHIISGVFSSERMHARELLFGPQRHP